MSMEDCWLKVKEQIKQRNSNVKDRKWKTEMKNYNSKREELEEEDQREDERNVIL